MTPTAVNPFQPAVPVSTNPAVPQELVAAPRPAAQGGDTAVLRKLVFSEPPAAPDGLADWLDPERLGDSSAEAPRLLDKIELPHPGDGGQGAPGGEDGGVVLPAVKLEDHPEVRQEWERYVAGKW